VSTLTMPGVDSMFSQDIDPRLVAAINDNPDPNAELLAMVTPRSRFSSLSFSLSRCSIFLSLFLSLSLSLSPYSLSL